MILLRHHGWAIFLILSAILICYSFMLGSSFKTLDDDYSVVHNPQIQQKVFPLRLFTEGYFGDKSYYRPLTNISYWWEYQHFGLNPFFYHLDNMLLHMLNTLGVYLLMLLLGPMWMAVMVAALFAIHPMHWEAVANVSGRAILLSSFFSLGMLISALLAYRRGKWSLWLWVSLGMFVGALLSKESGAGMLIVLAAILWGRKSNSQLALTILPFIGAFVLYLWLRSILGLTEIFQTNQWDIWFLGILSFAYAAIDWLRLFIFPFDLHFDRSSPFLVSFSDWRIFLTIAFWLMMFYLVYRRRKSFNSLDYIAGILIVISLLPVSQMVASIGVQPGRLSAAEHFLYFASIGVFYFIVKYGAIFIERQKLFSQTMMRMLVLLWVLGLMAVCIEQNIYASNEMAMIKRSLQWDPSNARLQYSMGLMYVKKGDFEKAREFFGQAVYHDPTNARYAISWGKSLCDTGKIDECLAVYDKINPPAHLADIWEKNRQAALNLKKTHDQVHH